MLQNALNHIVNFKNFPRVIPPDSRPLWLCRQASGEGKEKRGRDRKNGEKGKKRRKGRGIGGDRFWPP